MHTLTTPRILPGDRCLNWGPPFKIKDTCEKDFFHLIKPIGCGFDFTF